MTKRTGRSMRAPRTSRLEWAVAVLGVVVVVGLVGYMVWYGAHAESGPPSFRIAHGPAAPAGERYLIAFEVINTSASTAASVHVVGRLELANGVAEERRVAFDYVPDGGRRSGGLFFLNDPREHATTLLVEGYSRP